MRIKDLDLSKTTSPRRGISFGPTFLIFVLAVISLTVLLVLKCPAEPTQQTEEVVDADSISGRFSPVYWNTIVIPSLMRTAPTPPIR
mgnify:CR=1 FL=1